MLHSYQKVTFKNFSMLCDTKFFYIFRILYSNWNYYCFFLLFTYHLYFVIISFRIGPVEITMGLIGDKWKILIIRDLLTGTKRFGELRKSLNGISQKVLTNNLRDMEKSGLVHREAFAEVPPRVEYSLTETGWSLEPVLYSMVQWGNNYRELQK